MYSKAKKKCSQTFPDLSGTLLPMVRGTTAPGHSHGLSLCKVSQLWQGHHLPSHHPTVGRVTVWQAAMAITLPGARTPLCSTACAMTAQHLVAGTLCLQARAAQPDTRSHELDRQISASTALSTWGLCGNTVPKLKTNLMIKA